MAELKTKANDSSVTDFLNSVVDNKKRTDCYKLLDIMKEITGEVPKMWGPSIIGFGSYHYKYESGREGDWFLTGFSPRKQNITVYIMTGFREFDALLQNLGKYKTGKGCLYFNGLDKINIPVLTDLIHESTTAIKKKYS